MRKKIAAGNWKMNLTLNQGAELVSEVVAAGKPANVEVVFCTPYLFLNEMNKLVQRAGGYHVASQNHHEKEKGAYTGEISVLMLTDLGIKHGVIGHSERRQYNGETDALLIEKLDIAYKNDITPIFCCGEPLEIRKSGNHIEYVLQQLRNSIFHFPERIAESIIAYEPIWAIGTGETATPGQAEEMHAAIRQEIASVFGEDIAAVVPILYGGSVTAANAGELFSCPNVDGGLVGGASLKAADFIKIIHSF